MDLLPISPARQQLWSAGFLSKALCACVGAPAAKEVATGTQVALQEGPRACSVPRVGDRRGGCQTWTEPALLVVTFVPLQGGTMRGCKCGCAEVVCSSGATGPECSSLYTCHCHLTELQAGPSVPAPDSGPSTAACHLSRRM